MFGQELSVRPFHDFKRTDFFVFFFLFMNFFYFYFFKEVKVLVSFKMFIAGF